VKSINITQGFLDFNLLDINMYPETTFCIKT